MVYGIAIPTLVFFLQDKLWIFPYSYVEDICQTFLIFSFDQYCFRGFAGEKTLDYGFPASFGSMLLHVAHSYSLVKPIL